jgi:hypothetical protein
LFLWLTACLAAVAVSAEPAVISAHLEPEQITIGESAELTITMLGSGRDDLRLPVVNGLEFRVIGRSGGGRRIQGASLATTTLTVRVTPRTAGIFAIPGITPDAQPLVLRVARDATVGNAGASASASASAAPRSGRAGSAPTRADEAAAAGMPLSPDGPAFLRLILPKREVYVGESVPVEIELGVRPGFVQTLNGLPTLTSGEFTLNNLNQPERSERAVAGKAFVLLTWHSVIAPVKAGAFTLAAEAPITVRISTRSAGDARIDDLLGDPFLQNIYGPSVKKDIRVASPPVTLAVAALPADARPADFSGAVGSFQITSELSATTAAAGDPLTLRMRVTGSGNFDRVDSAMLEHLDHWKTYPPRATFQEKPHAQLQGEKVFEQPLIAARAGAQTLPGLVFSYFDPNTRRYETVRTAPLAVTITPAAADAAPPATDAATAGAASSAAGGGATTDAAADSGLRPDHAVTSGGHVPSLRPLYLRPLFFGIPDHSAAAFYNAANGYARAGKTGLAVLYFERAQVLAPSDADIAANLRLVREAAHLPDAAPSVFERAVTFAAPAAFAWLGVGGMIGIGAGVLLGRRRPGGVWQSTLLLTAGALCISLTVANGVALWPRLHGAVVITPDASVRATPAPMSDELFRISEGDTVRVEAEHEDFLFVRTAQAREGWVARAALGLVMP